MHKFAQIRLRRFWVDMKVIRHAAKTIYHNVIKRRELSKFFYKQFVVLVVMKYRSALITTINNTVTCVFKFNSNGSRYARRKSFRSALVVLDGVVPSEDRGVPKYSSILRRHNSACTANPKGGHFLPIFVRVEDGDPRIDLLPRERKSIKNCSVHYRRTYAERI